MFIVVRVAGNKVSRDLLSRRGKLRVRVLRSVQRAELVQEVLETHESTADSYYESAFLALHEHLAPTVRVDALGLSQEQQAGAQTGLRVEKVRQLLIDAVPWHRMVLDACALADVGHVVAQLVQTELHAGKVGQFLEQL